MSDEITQNMIKHDEGCRYRVYLDTKNIPTVGYGHALHIGSRIPKVVAELLFQQDYQSALDDYNILATNHSLKLNPARKSVVVNMLFNMGLVRVNGFRKMLRAIRNKDYIEAAKEMLDSKWAKYDVSSKRSKPLSKMMETGEFNV